MDLKTPLLYFVSKVLDFFLLAISPILALRLNTLDIIIMFVFLFYTYEGYTIGFVLAALDLFSFVLSFIIALKYYSFVGEFLRESFAMPPGFANALGFFILALFSEILLNFFFRKVYVFVKRKTKNIKIQPFLSQCNKPFGVLPGFVSASIILAFLLSATISLPSSPFLKELVIKSRIGSYLVANTATFENAINDVFGDAISETLNFLTVKPQSTESVQLRFTVKNGKIDKEAEEEMLYLVNKARVARGLEPLSMDGKLRSLARDYSGDMFRKGYFSHYTPDNPSLSPFNRMDKAGIMYGFAGENLALAPSTGLAMQGLMSSPGHRANILQSNFKKVGIGVMDGGIYGKMFSQEFTD